MSSILVYHCLFPIIYGVLVGLIAFLYVLSCLMKARKVIGIVFSLFLSYSYSLLLLPILVFIYISILITITGNLADTLTLYLCICYI